MAKFCSLVYVLMHILLRIAEKKFRNNLVDLIKKIQKSGMIFNTFTPVF